MAKFGDVPAPGRLPRRPIITARLEDPTAVEAARVVKARLEKTTLGEICARIREVYGPRKCYLEVELDASLIGRLHLELDADAVRAALLAGVVSAGRAPPVIRALKPEFVLLNPDHKNTLQVIRGQGGTSVGRRRPSNSARFRSKGDGRRRKRL